MALSRLQASLVSATNEVTVAAAKINFDFTLIKNEAPKEYHDLGRTLSKRRREEAETGTAHITARRLGALFQDICPQTPMLVQAYGSRVSEIAKQAKMKTETDTMNGIFADHAGVDGTSIWAAAISSKPALHMQLLAAMLARIWTAPEATSVWVELVKERRKETAGRFERGEELPYSTLTAAAQAEISRAQLAEWDASARAWLKTADSIKRREQVQLMLILNNIEISVNKTSEVLTSIIGAWRSALMSMERLIGGMAQQNDSGPTLLALGSWHLYPDVLVVSKETKDFQFKDDLVDPGGILTVGLEKSHSIKDGNRGLHWSLSLAHLRYYGRPVQANGRLAPDSGGISFSQFVHVTFGCFLGYWKMDRQRKLEGVARFFVSAHAAIERAAATSERTDASDKARNFLSNSNHWWNLFSNTAPNLIDESKEEDTDKLVKLGIRRSSKFLSSNSSASNHSGEPFTFFGLMEAKPFVYCLKGTEERIAYLRHYASALHSSNKSFIIRYYRKPNLDEYATAIPVPVSSKKRKADDDVAPVVYRHKRWLRFLPDERILLEEECHEVDTNTFDPQDETCFFIHDRNWTSQARHLMFGDPNTAAIFQETSRPSGQPSMEDVMQSLDEGLFSVKKLLKMIEEYHFVRYPEAAKALVALSAASTIYKLLPEAMISLQVFDRHIASRKWAACLLELCDKSKKGKHPIFDSHYLVREIAMSCVAYMDSGSQDIKPSVLENVMAMSFGDSLYIAMRLACDPWEDPAEYELKRVLGNVGRPGITFLVPPKNPILREVDPRSWKIVNNASFNFRAENHFHRTSLHLNFTDYYFPIANEQRHGRDSEAFYLEAVVSVHESGEWVGDLDIIKSLNHLNIHITRPTGHFCNNPQDHASAPEDVQELDSELISAECWDEILDLPKRGGS